MAETQNQERQYQGLETSSVVRRRFTFRLGALRLGRGYITQVCILHVRKEKEQ